MSRLPEINEYVRGSGILVAVEDVTPDPPPPVTKVYIFQEIAASIRLLLNGEMVKDFTTFNDFYGKETSISSAIEEAKKYVRKYKIGPTSDAEIIVVRVVSHVKKTMTRKENFYDKEFFDFEPLPSGNRWNVPPDTEEIVWSSRTWKHQS